MSVICPDRKSHCLGLVCAALVLVFPRTAQAQTVIFEACYVPTVGAMYFINLPGLPTACLDTAHTKVTLGDGTVTLADGSVTTLKLADLAVTAGKLAGDAVDGSKIADGAVAAADLANNAVTSAKIADGSIVAADIDTTLDAAYRDPGSLADGSVTTLKLADLAVTAGKLAGDAVDGSKIADGAVAAADLANNAVTSAKIADGSIVAADIATGGVASAEILDGSVTGTDIAVNTITAADLASNAVTLLVRYQTGTQVTLLANDNSTVVSATCTNAGELVVGGWWDSTFNSQMDVTESFRSSGSTWVLDFYNPNAFDIAVNWGIVCASLSM